MNILERVAREQSTFIIDVSFFDEDDVAVAPDTATWTLTKGDGTVVNSRTAVAIDTPGVTESIVLSGDDLAVDEANVEEVLRVLTIEATYESGTFGAGLPLVDAIGFHVRALAAVE